MGQYGLADIVVIEDLGLWGPTLRLHCQTTSGYHFFLKEKAYYLAPDDWRIHLTVHRWSENAHGPVSPLLRTRQGNNGVTYDGRQFEMQGWVAGRPPPADDAEQFGRTLALFHESVAQMPAGSRIYPRSRYRWTPDDHASLVQYIDRYCRPRADNSPTAARCFDGLDKRVSKLHPGEPANDLTESYLHGDTALANAVWADDHSLRLIDFDDARWGVRIFDLAHAVAIVAGFDERQAGRYVVRDEWSLHRAAGLISGYRAVIEPTPAERADFPRQMSIAAIAVGLSCLDIDDPEFELPTDLADQLDRLSKLVSDAAFLSSSAINL